MTFRFAVCLSLLPFAAQAESTLERYEALGKEMNIAMGEMMAREIDQNGGNGDIVRAALPTADWTDEMRAASECLLGRYETEIGADGVSAMLDTMESALPELATMTMTQFTESNWAEKMVPEGLSEDAPLAISQECGVMELQIEMMQKSGFSEALMEASATVPD